MKTNKKILLFSILFCQLAFVFAGTAKYQTEAYTLNVTYNDTLVPGDALFVRLSITTPKNHKKNKVEPNRYAILQLYQDKKIIEKSEFYSLGKRKNQFTTDLLCGVPLSTYLENADYSLKVIFCFDETTNEEFSLPLIFKNREFFTEAIDLDENNTQIKTDNSPERIAQITKLNNILFTTYPTDIYAIQNFVKPTPSERYTAHFGDRRTYVYTNGKKSTSLHYGNDYGIIEGSAIAACADGKVVMAENRISTGWSIVIEHLPGLYSLYYHLSEMNVKEGDFVHQYDIIGKSGSTGLATGPHLHWEIRLNGEAVRPEFFISNFSFE